LLDARRDPLQESEVEMELALQLYAPCEVPTAMASASTSVAAANRTASSGSVSIDRGDRSPTSSMPASVPAPPRRGLLGRARRRRNRKDTTGDRGARVSVAPSVRTEGRTLGSVSCTPSRRTTARERSWRLAPTGMSESMGGHRWTCSLDRGPARRSGSLGKPVRASDGERARYRLTARSARTGVSSHRAPRGSLRRRIAEPRRPARRSKWRDAA